MSHPFDAARRWGRFFGCAGALRAVNDKTRGMLPVCDGGIPRFLTPKGLGIALSMLLPPAVGADSHAVPLSS